MSAAVKWHDYLSRALFAARCSRSTSLLRVSLSVLLPFFFFLSFLPFFFFFSVILLPPTGALTREGFCTVKRSATRAPCTGKRGGGRKGG